MEHSVIKGGKHWSTPTACGGLVMVGANDTQGLHMINWPIHKFSRIILLLDQTLIPCCEVKQHSNHPRSNCWPLCFSSSRPIQCSNWCLCVTFLFPRRRRRLHCHAAGSPLQLFWFLLSPWGAARPSGSRRTLRQWCMNVYLKRGGWCWGGGGSRARQQGPDHRSSGVSSVSFPHNYHSFLRH